MQSGIKPDQPVFRSPFPPGRPVCGDCIDHAIRHKHVPDTFSSLVGFGYPAFGGHFQNAVHSQARKKQPVTVRGQAGRRPGALARMRQRCEQAVAGFIARISGQP